MNNMDRNNKYNKITTIYNDIRQNTAQNHVICCRILSKLLYFVLFCNNILLVFYAKGLYNIVQSKKTIFQGGQYGTYFDFLQKND